MNENIAIGRNNLAPRLQSQIRAMAAYDNPVFFKNLYSKRSNWNISSVIDLGASSEDAIFLPLGLLESVKSHIDETGIRVNITDNRIMGDLIPFRFTQTLREYQISLINEIMDYDRGVLEAATGTRKTIMAAALIARYRVPVLILVQSNGLVSQWKKALSSFLSDDSNEDNSLTVGEYSGKKKMLTKQIDVATIQALLHAKDSESLLDGYGLVFFDECHHAASMTSMKMLARIRAKRVYGLSATPERRDGMEKSIFMMIGPIRCVFLRRKNKKNLVFITECFADILLCCQKIET